MRFPLAAGAWDLSRTFTTWTLISHSKPISDIRVLLGLPENAELQLQSIPGNSQGEMEEKVGFVTVFGND